MITSKMVYLSTSSSVSVLTLGGVQGFLARFGRLPEGASSTALLVHIEDGGDCVLHTLFLILRSGLAVFQYLLFCLFRGVDLENKVAGHRLFRAVHLDTLRHDGVPDVGLIRVHVHQAQILGDLRQRLFGETSSQQSYVSHTVDSAPIALRVSPPCFL